MAMQVIVAAVLPVLITVLIGFALARAKQPFDGKTITLLVGTIGTPALVFSQLAKMPAPERMLPLAAATAVALILFTLLGAALLKSSGLKLRTYLPSLSIPNAGNLGLPLALYATGQAGLNDAIVIFAVITVFSFTVGNAIAAGRAKWREVLSNPIVPATLLGAAWSYWRLPIPVWMDNTLALLAGFAIPLMLLMLGTSLARIKVRMFGRAAYVAALRLSLGIAVGFAVAALFGFEGVEHDVFVLQCAMPVAVYNYFFAQIYKNDPEEIASLIVVSTLMSLVTIPPLLAVLVG